MSRAKRDTVRSRMFCVTGWEHLEGCLDQLKKEAEIADYALIGRELAPSTGKVHYQCIFRFECQRYLEALRKRLPGCDVRVTRGHLIQASDYCFKEEDIILEKGSRVEQGKRSDIIAVKEEILSGKKVDDIALERPELYHQYGRTLNKIEELQMRKKYRMEMTEGIWYWGETGVGKSHLAFKDFTPETHYVFPDDNGWWDGYCQQETVIINEFRGGIAYKFLLELCDKWPLSVKRRGREPMPFTSKRIIVTSCCKPEEVYKNLSASDSLTQLYRRFKVIHVLRDPDTGEQVLHE